MYNLNQDAKEIYTYAINEVLPDSAVKKALAGKDFSNGKIILVAIGKAAFQMAKSALEVLPRVDEGIVITKYHHVLYPLEEVECYEAGHPIVDENSIKATARALEITADLTAEDNVVFLISGGGSALFEDPLVDLKQLQDLNRQLLACGASITEINIIRKRLSKVKAGRFAQHCYPAQVYSVVLSDVVGDKLDAIASGPAYPDSSTVEEALKIVTKYNLNCSTEILDCLNTETPKQLDNVETMITGSVNQLVQAAKTKAIALGYQPIILTTDETQQASLVGKQLAIKATQLAADDHFPTALIGGGETIVYITGRGKGGRNQELALSAAHFIEGYNITIFSVGSDGTDGPTEAAGGIVDGTTQTKLTEKNISIDTVLKHNDSYNALKEVDSLIFTGPTGTNVNDLFVALIV